MVLGEGCCCYYVGSDAVIKNYFTVCVVVVTAMLRVLVLSMGNELVVYPVQNNARHTTRILTACLKRFSCWDRRFMTSLPSNSRHD